MAEDPRAVLLRCHGYVMVLECPDCRQDQSVKVTLGTTHTSTIDGSKLRPTLHAKPVDHRCGQLTLGRIAESDPMQVGLTFGDDDG